MLNLYIFLAYLSILFDYCYLFIGTELFIAIALIIFHFVIQYFFGKSLISLLYNKNIFIFQIFANLFAFNIISENIILRFFNFIFISEINQYIYILGCLFYFYQVFFISNYINLIKGFSKLNTYIFIYISDISFDVYVTKYIFILNNNIFNFEKKIKSQLC